ncbi:MAG: murein biosynthesis integral membrane protein MurJ [Deltaproteobacteria bacterium]|jgi:putative peptidoglycan lipid II flippase|nr:murein biosynthesis integral membrane protein MurJ [Deltaproteobacteria bacterium]
MPRLTSRHSLSAAALLMAASIFLSRLMGLARDKVISWQFGAGADTDVYVGAVGVPDFINYLLAGGYISMTLIPLLTARFRENEDDGWNFFSAALTWNTALACALCVLGWVFAPELARLTAPGFSAGQLTRLAFYLRIVLPGQIFFLAGACLTALLYIRTMFAVPALTPLIYNGCIIVGGLVWPYLAGQEAAGGMTGYAAGVTVGAACGAFAMPLYAAWTGGLRLRLRFGHPLLRRYILLALPLMLGQSIVVLDEQLIRVFGSLAGEGTLSLLTYARRIMLVPVGVVAQAAGVAAFPFLASLAANDERTAFHATLGDALKRGLFAVLPLTAWMIAAAQPILGLIFEGGRFDVEDTAHGAPLLQLFLCGVPFWLVQQVIGRAFYAWQDTLTPAVIGTLVTLAVLPIYPCLARTWHGPGVAGLSAASIILYALILCLWWRRRFGPDAFAGLVRPALVCAGLAAAAGLAARLAMVFTAGRPLPDLLHGLPETPAGLIVHLFGLGVSALVFGLVYLASARLFLPDALRLHGSQPDSTAA